MTIPASMPISASYQGDGVTVNFPVPFMYFANADGTKQIAVIVADKSGENEQTLKENTDFTITAAGQPEGTLTLNTPLAATKKISIVYNIPIEQVINWVEFARLPSESIEAAFDRVVAILKQFEEVLSRCIKVGITSNVTPKSLVEYVERVYDSIGNIDITTKNITNINTTANNIEAILAAPTEAKNAAASATAAETSQKAAATSANLSRKWAIGSDEEIPEQGEHSSKSNAALAFAIANADEDVPIDDFGLPADTFIKGEKGDPGPQLEECINAINENGNRILSRIDTAQAKADALIAGIENNKELVLSTAAEVLVYRNQAKESEIAAAASGELANKFANAGEDEIIATE